MSPSGKGLGGLGEAFGKGGKKPSKIPGGKKPPRAIDLLNTQPAPRPGDLKDGGGKKPSDKTTKKGSKSDTSSKKSSSKGKKKRRFPKLKIPGPVGAQIGQMGKMVKSISAARNGLKNVRQAISQKGLMGAVKSSVGSGVKSGVKIAARLAKQAVKKVAVQVAKKIGPKLAALLFGNPIGLIAVGVALLISLLFVIMFLVIDRTGDNDLSAGDTGSVLYPGSDNDKDRNRESHNGEPEHLDDLTIKSLLDDDRPEGIFGRYPTTPGLQEVIDTMEGPLLGYTSPYPMLVSGVGGTCECTDDRCRFPTKNGEWWSPWGESIEAVGDDDEWKIVDIHLGCHMHAAGMILASIFGMDGVPHHYAIGIDSRRMKDTLTTLEKIEDAGITCRSAIEVLQDNVGKRVNPLSPEWIRALVHCTTPTFSFYNDDWPGWLWMSMSSMLRDTDIVHVDYDCAITINSKQIIIDTATVSRVPLLPDFSHEDEYGKAPHSSLYNYTTSDDLEPGKLLMLKNCPADRYVERLTTDTDALGLWGRIGSLCYDREPVYDGVAKTRASLEILKTREAEYRDALKQSESEGYISDESLVERAFESKPSNNDLAELNNVDASRLVTLRTRHKNEDDDLQDFELTEMEKLEERFKGVAEVRNFDPDTSDAAEKFIDKSSKIATYVASALRSIETAEEVVNIFTNELMYQIGFGQNADPKSEVPTFPYVTAPKDVRDKAAQVLNWALLRLGDEWPSWVECRDTDQSKRKEMISVLGLEDTVSDVETSTSLPSRSTLGLLIRANGDDEQSEGRSYNKVFDPNIEIDDGGLMVTRLLRIASLLSDKISWVDIWSPYPRSENDDTIRFPGDIESKSEVEERLAMTSSFPPLDTEAAAVQANRRSTARAVPEAISCDSYLRWIRLENTYWWWELAFATENITSIPSEGSSEGICGRISATQDPLPYEWWSFGKSYLCPSQIYLEENEPEMTREQMRGRPENMSSFQLVHPCMVASVSALGIASNLATGAESSGALRGGGFRSNLEQRKLYAAFQKDKAAGLEPVPVAEPGNSRHEYGLALDMTWDINISIQTCHDNEKFNDSDLWVQECRLNEINPLAQPKSDKEKEDPYKWGKNPHKLCRTDSNTDSITVAFDKGKLGPWMCHRFLSVAGESVGLLNLRKTKKDSDEKVEPWHWSYDAG